MKILKTVVRLWVALQVLTGVIWFKPDNSGIVLRLFPDIVNKIMEVIKKKKRGK